MPESEQSVPFFLLKMIFIRATLILRIILSEKVVWDNDNVISIRYRLSLQRINWLHT